MSDCIFCKIVDKKLPAEIVYEDPDYLAFLDIKPLAAGHTLLIPKKHYRWVWNLPRLGNFFETAQKIALAQRKAFGTEAIWAKIVGEEITHAHVWIFPDPRPGQTAGDKNDLKTNAEKLRPYLRTGLV